MITGNVQLNGCSSVRAVASICDSETTSWLAYPSSIQAECACTFAGFPNAVSDCVAFFSSNSNYGNYSTMSQVTNICSTSKGYGEVYSNTSSTGFPVETNPPFVPGGARRVKVPVCHMFSRLTQLLSTRETDKQLDRNENHIVYSNIDFVMLNRCFPLVIAIHRSARHSLLGVFGVCIWKAKFPHIE